MATNYPSGIDSLTNPSAGDALTSPSHSAQHANANDAIEAIETELGVNPSGSDATVAARLSAIEAGTNLATGAVTSAKIADGTIVNDDINASAAIARSKISGLPTSSTDNTVARFDSTAGAIQTSGVVIDDNNRLTVATGATGGYGFASGAVHLSGTGTPEGVVTAAPGSTWLQTSGAATNTGMLSWRKATGTGNTGWVAEGALADTGWRAVNCDGGWTGTVLFRRVGNVVEFSGAGSNPTMPASGTTLLSALPAGFAPDKNVVFSTRNTSTGVVSGGLVIPSVMLYYGTLVAGQAIIFGQTYTTSQSWPTSLPGTGA